VRREAGARWRWIQESAAAGVVLRMCPHVDGIIEGFRPGVMERSAWVERVACARIRASSIGR